MKHIYLILAVISSFFLLNCTDNFDERAIDYERRNFIWTGMNTYYLWQKDVPNLKDSYILNQGDRQLLFKNYLNPESLFQGLRVDPIVDRFSLIVSDYVALEQALSGTASNNGVDYELRRKTAGSTDLFGVVRYILPNSDASTKNIQRGDIFTAVGGEALTIDNYRRLLAPTTYTLNMASYNAGAFTPNNVSVSLTKMPYTENPVYYTNVYTNGTKKIGYLVYNGFYAQYDTQLNTAIGNLKNQGITHLILDLRYNSGGSVNSAIRLSSMITGQFDGQIFAKQIWNDKVMRGNAAESFINRFSNNNGIGALNNLNLTKLYVITTKATASASELLINSLKPYIPVVQIGATTTGKNVGSITLYDSPNFSKSNVNTNHKYAMQPITFRTVNKADFGDYATGLIPDFVQAEDLSNFGVIGNATEPLLQIALAQVALTGRYANTKNSNNIEANFVSDTKQLNNNGGNMNLDNPKVKPNNTSISE